MGGFRWEDPEWKAAHLAKMAAGVAARRERLAAEKADKFVSILEVVRESGRADEGAGPENPSGNASTVGSNPTSPAISWACGIDGCDRLKDHPGVHSKELDALLNDPEWKKIGRIAAGAPTDYERAVDLLRRFYLATRLRSAAGGWQPGKCAACNVPHVRGICVHRCPCHEAGEYLAGLEREKEVG